MTASNILVVDDEADIRGLIEEILSEEGYTVSAAERQRGPRADERRVAPTWYCWISGCLM